MIETDWSCSIDMNSDQLDEASHNMNDKYFNQFSHAKRNQLPAEQRPLDKNKDVMDGDDQR